MTATVLMSATFMVPSFSLTSVEGCQQFRIPAIGSCCASSQMSSEHLQNPVLLFTVN
jgi:hypothetical protein